MDLVRLDATTAGGAELRSALLASSEWLDGHAARIDALNVFPVPDGDTGTNMSLTLRAAADALREASEPASVSDGGADRLPGGPAGRARQLGRHPLPTAARLRRGARGEGADAPAPTWQRR